MDLPIAPPIDVYIVAGCGDGCQASTLNPRVYHRPAIVLCPRNLQLSDTYPALCEQCLCVSLSGLEHSLASWVYAFLFHLLSLAVNLLVDCVLPPAIRSMQHY